MSEANSGCSFPALTNSTNIVVISSLGHQAPSARRRSHLSVRLQVQGFFLLYGVKSLFFCLISFLAYLLDTVFKKFFQISGYLPVIIGIGISQHLRHISGSFPEQFLTGEESLPHLFTTTIPVSSQ